jgi:hypothetical protein
MLSTKQFQRFRLGRAPKIQNLRRQAGFFIESMVIALLIGAIAAALTYKDKHQSDMAGMAVIQADGLKNVANAAETLVMEHYDSYQGGVPVVRNGVTLAFGTAPGEAMTPTLANLRGMALGLTPGSDFGNYKTLVDATYITRIERIPAGCETSPGGQDCNIRGTVCLDRPVQDFGAPAGEFDDFGIGIMLSRIGGDSGSSILGSAGTISGSGGAWSVANPFAGAPAGLVCQRFGFGSAAFGRFLRVRDSRNPDFQGALTVNNSINTTNGTIGAGTGNPGPGECRLGEIMNSGQFISRSASCIRRAWVDGANGEIGVADATGTPRAQLRDTGEILSKDSSGTVKAGFTYAGTESQAKADRLETNAGTAGLRPNGETFGNSIVINTDAAPGGACPTNNAMVWGNGANNLKLLKCVANVWQATGTAIGAIGGACTNNGELGETTAKVSIICVGNVWQTTTSRMGKWAVSEQYLVGHGTVVAKPACGSGAIPRIVAIPKLVNATYVLQNFDVVDNGPSWTTNMTGPTAAEIAWALAVAQVGCWYP